MLEGSQRIVCACLTAVFLLVYAQRNRHFRPDILVGKIERAAKDLFDLTAELSICQRTAERAFQNDLGIRGHITADHKAVPPGHSAFPAIVAAGRQADAVLRHLSIEGYDHSSPPIMVGILHMHVLLGRFSAVFSDDYLLMNMLFGFLRHKHKLDSFFHLRCADWIGFCPVLLIYSGFPGASRFSRSCCRPIRFRCVRQCRYRAKRNRHKDGKCARNQLLPEHVHFVPPVYMIPFIFC